jgi:hypothetical protein
MMLRMADDACCPGCNEKLTGATAFEDGAVPKPGDLSVCAHCGCLLQFTDALGHVEHLPASVFKALPIEERKMMARLQVEVLAALKAGRI